MPRYIIERNVGAMSQTELEAAARRSLEVINNMPGVLWIKSYVSKEEGKMYCEYEAPNQEAIREHARRAGLPADQISEVALEVSPDMFHWERPLQELRARAKDVKALQSSRLRWRYGGSSFSPIPTLKSTYRQCPPLPPPGTRA